MAEITIDIEHLIIRPLTSSIPLSKAEHHKFHVTTHPDRVLLMPDMECVIEVLTTMGLPGEYAITVPFLPNHDCAYIDNLTIIAKAIGPRLRINEAELDYGLIGVGETTKRTLLITNESNVPAKFLFHPTCEVDYQVSG